VAEPPQWLSTKQASDWLGITARTLYRMIDEGGVPAYRLGRVIRLKQRDLEDFVESLRIEPGTLGHLYPGGEVLEEGDEGDPDNHT
jgi:excisionase family DNA binding protein